jgi:hypothetical protein
MATRRKIQGDPGGKPAAQRPKRIEDDEVLGEELIRTSREQHAGFVAGWRQFMKRLGIPARPISAEKLREMAIREGLDPESNEFSQGIIAAREE